MTPSRYQQSSAWNRRSRRLRRGTGYVLVMGAAMLVAVIALSSVALVRVQQRTQEAAVDSSRANLYARSAVETAVAYSVKHSNWRNLYSNLASGMPWSFDLGSCSFTITEPDGSSLNTTWDNPVLITGTGTVGDSTRPQAQRRLSVSAHQPPLPILGTALHSAADIAVNPGTAVHANDGPLSTNAMLTNQSAIYGDVETRNLANSGTISGKVTLITTDKLMPDSSTFNYYRTLSTAVTLPAWSIGSTMQWALLSPNSNPWDSGHTSPDGLYYIQPGGDLTIRDARIVGTLLVDLNPGRKLVLDTALLWEPARPDFPSLIVRGNCEIRFSDSLSESGQVNFNPESTPYHDSYNTNMSDTFPSVAKGLFHIVGQYSTLLIDNDPQMLGTIISEGPVTLHGEPTLTADPNLLLVPPMHYRMSYLQIDPGSWKPVVGTN